MILQAFVVADQLSSPERTHGGGHAAEGLKMYGCHAPRLLGNHGDDAGHLTH